MEDFYNGDYGRQKLMAELRRFFWYDVVAVISFACLSIVLFAAQRMIFGAIVLALTAVYAGYDAWHCNKTYTELRDIPVPKDPADPADWPGL